MLCRKKNGKPYLKSMTKKNYFEVFLLPRKPAVYIPVKHTALFMILFSVGLHLAKRFRILEFQRCVGPFWIGLQRLRLFTKALLWLMPNRTILTKLGRPATRHTPVRPHGGCVPRPPSAGRVPPVRFRHTSKIEAAPQPSACAPGALRSDRSTGAIGRLKPVAHRPPNHPRLRRPRPEDPHARQRRDG